MSRARVAAIAVCVALAVLCGLAALDLRGWEGALRRAQAHDALLPGDPVGRALDAREELSYRRALAAYAVAVRTPRGFDNGERRARSRSAAEALLSEVAITVRPGRAGQAQTLLGVLAVSGGRVAGLAASERARNAWETAVRIDPEGTDAKYDLELLLRREGPTGTREGPESGAGPRGESQRGAGSGTPGRGY